MLVIIKFIPVILLFCSINTHSFIHDKSSSISQFIKGKSRNLQKLPRYLSGIATSTFKLVLVLDLHLLHLQVFLVYFLLFLFYIAMIYHLKQYHQHHRFRLYNNSINFLMSYNNFDYILTDYTLTLLYQYLLHCLSMYCTINEHFFKCNIFFSFMIFICSSS